MEMVMEIVKTLLANGYEQEAEDFVSRCEQVLA